ncbi:MAG: Hpt domain-containing protein, partial [Thiopseudomonas sp.]
MVEIFLDEALDLLDSANQNLEQWLANPDSSTCLTVLMRDAHTLKGGAQMAEITPVGDLAHELEQTYEGLLDGRYGGNSGLDDLLLGAHAELAALFGQLQTGAALQQPQDIIRGLQNYRQGVVEPTAVKIPDADSGQTVQSDGTRQPVQQPVAAEPVYIHAGPDSELTEIFLEEAFEVLENMASGLQNWLSDRDNLVHVEGLQRDLHTL